MREKYGNNWHTSGDRKAERDSLLSANYTVWDMPFGGEPVRIETRKGHPKDGLVAVVYARPSKTWADPWPYYILEDSGGFVSSDLHTEAEWMSGRIDRYDTLEEIFAAIQADAITTGT